MENHSNANNRIRKTLWHRVSAMKIILWGYVAIILVGTLLLMLPCSTKPGEATTFTNSLFTATSATCVTGLVRFDTFTHWTLFGQLVILILIQIGGIGFMTVALLVMMATKMKIGLTQRSIMKDSISAPELGGMVKTTKFILKGTFIIELLGAILLSVHYIPAYGVIDGIYFSIFHSISAFCNGGFDLMGKYTGPCSSMTSLESNLYVNVVLMILIIVGGLGFFVWADLLRKKFSIKRLALQSKVVLSMSVFLVVAGALILYVIEYNGQMYQGYSDGTKLLSCFFQSVSARTAGMNSCDMAKMSEAGIMVMIILMLIGGSTGSTAGGMKTTTLFVLLAGVRSTFLRRKNIEIFGRRLDENLLKTASCIFVTYITVIISSTIIISSIDNIPLLSVLFECTSALATVGITLGITGSLSMVSKLIITLLMLCGRVGSVTMLLAFSSDKGKFPSKLPMENLSIG